MDGKQVEWQEVEVDVGWGTLRGKTCIVGDSQETGDKLRIVGLHGWLDNCNTFDGLVPLLPSTVEVLVFDFPGHGLSDHLPLGAHYNPFLFACNIHKAVTKLGWNEFMLMGHSMGGGITCLFTALFPDYVKGVIVLDFLGPADNIGFVEASRIHVTGLIKAEKLVKQPPLVYSEAEAIDRLVNARVLRYSDAPTVTTEAAQTLLPRSTREVEGGYIWSHDLKARSNFLSLINGQRWIDIISTIKCPVFLVLAEDGTNRLPPDYLSVVFNAYSNNSKYFCNATINGSHHVHLTNPELVAPIISPFLNQVLAVETSSQLVRAKL